jgi:hypothetical protein
LRVDNSLVGLRVRMHRSKWRVTTVSTRLPGAKGEYLWEFDIAERQLLALAEAFPSKRYGWRSAETARSVREVSGAHCCRQSYAAQHCGSGSSARFVWQAGRRGRSPHDGRKIIERGQAPLRK